MKKLIVTVGILVVVMAGLVFGGYNHADPLPSAPDCIDSLLPIPPAVIRQFGATEKTRLVYNIAEILKACNLYKAQIEALAKQVAALQRDLDTAKALVEELEARPVYDPNECACIEIGELINTSIISFYDDSAFTVTAPYKVIK